MKPVAVDAALGRPVYIGLRGVSWASRPLDAVSIRGRTYCQAPWFFGSSWHHTSSACGYVSIASFTWSADRAMVFRHRSAGAARAGVGRAEGEGAELLHADERNVRDVVQLARPLQIVVDLAAAQDQPPHLVRRHQILLRGRAVTLLDHAPEPCALGHLGHFRRRLLQPQRELARHADQRLAEVAQDLPPQHVVVVRGGGAVHHLSPPQSSLQLLRDSKQARAARRTCQLVL